MSQGSEEGSEGSGGGRGSGGRRRPGREGEPAPKRRPGIRGREYLLTYPQYECDRKELCDFIANLKGVENIVVSCETHKKKEGKHMHAAVKFADKETRAPEMFTFRGRRPNIKLRRWGTAVRYVIKEDTEPACHNVDIDAFKAKKKALSIADVNKMTPMQIAETVPAAQYRQIVLGTYIMRAETAEYVELTAPKGIWITGPPGAGKTFIRRLIQIKYKRRPYIKALNKWWDGYKQEPIAIMDEVGRSNAAWLGDDLKRWTDEYGDTGEVKGASTPLTFRVFIITSNYRFEELWEDDSRIRDALERRFKTYTMTHATRDETQAAIMEHIAQLMEAETFDFTESPQAQADTDLPQPLNELPE